jgi:uncharacterized membrane protein
VPGDFPRTLMDPVLVLVQAFHVLAGVVWLGGAVFMNTVVLPAIVALPDAEQRAMARRVIFGPERMMIAAALLAAMLGILRGTVYGPVRSVDALATPYGIVWGLAIAITLSVFLVGARMTGPAAHRLLDDDRLWTSPASREVSGARADGFRLVRRSFRLELIGILLVFGLMPILRFL